MNIPEHSERRRLFHRDKPRSNPYRILLWIGLILVAYMVYRGTQQGVIKPFLSPTETPTRTINSFQQEADTYFQIGNLDAAIGSYGKAITLNPNDAALYTRLARIQTYSSQTLSTDQEKLDRMKAALASIDQAIKLAPDDSSAHAIRAFVLDWLSSNALLSPDETRSYLAQAETEATQAIRLDEQNVEALAFTAEIYMDQQKWVQSQQAIEQAMERAPDNVDVRRIHAYVLNNMGDYDGALAEYEQTARMAPNLTFLYIEIGKLYRHRAQVLEAQYYDIKSPDYLTPKLKAQVDQTYQTALDTFAKAATMNEQLGLRDPTPYIAIANTYSEMGEFFSAVRNARKALELNPGNAASYAQLGLVYQKARNYEGAIDAFRCALDGCAPEQSCQVRQDCDAPPGNYTISPEPLTQNTLIYYYTYGSVLAALSKPTVNLCPRATDIFTKIRAFTNEGYVMNIVEAGESICSAEPSPSPTQTVVPTVKATP